MDPDITQLAKMMRAWRAAGGAPYVLLLGSSLSLTPEVRRAVGGSDDWETFWTAVEICYRTLFAATGRELSRSSPAGA